MQFYLKPEEYAYTPSEFESYIIEGNEINEEGFVMPYIVVDAGHGAYNWR